MIRFRFLNVVLVVSLFTTACGGGKSPTSPTASSGPPSKVIELSGSLALGEILVGASREATLTIRNTGNTALSFTGITATGGLTNFCAATPTSGSVPAGGSLAVVFRCTPTTAGNFSGTITITADQTSGTNTTTLSLTAVAPPVTLVGVIVDANTRAPLGSVRVSVGSSSTTTDGNGYYSLVVPSGSITVSYSRSGYNSQTSNVTLTGDTRRDVNLVPLWTVSGVGNTVFDMPSYVSRVRITGRYDSNSSNFIVRIGGRLVVNELLGRAWSSTTYNGLHLTTGGVVEITNSRDVTWTFTQEQ